MARPKAIEKRERQINVALTTREHDLVKSRAEQIGQRVSDYARNALLKRQIAADAMRLASTTDRLAFEQMKRIGANLAEIRGHMQITGQMPSASLERVLRDIRDIINRDQTP
jgi:hypothetical protein